MTATDYLEVAYTRLPVGFFIDLLLLTGSLWVGRIRHERRKRVNG